MHRRGRTVDLIPRRGWVHAVGLVLGAGLIAGLLGLYHAAGPFVGLAENANARAFDLSSTASLATWLTSTWLMVIAGASLVVYSLRRHKMSDYKSSYRLWLWTAGAAVLTSTMATSGWHLALGDWLSNSLGWQLPGGASTYQLAPALAVLSVLGLRMVLEVARLPPGDDRRGAVAGRVGIVLGLWQCGRSDGVGQFDRDGRSWLPNGGDLVAVDVDRLVWPDS